MNSNHNYIIRKSKILIIIIIAIHIGSAVCIGFANFYSLLKLLLNFILLISFVYYIKRAFEIVEIRKNSDGEWLLVNAYHEKIQAIICGSSVVTNFIIVLCFKRKDNNAKRLFKFGFIKLLYSSVVICFDAISKDEFRRLKVDLLTEKAFD